MWNLIHIVSTFFRVKFVVAMCVYVVHLWVVTNVEKKTWFTKMFFILQQQTRERELERDDAAKIQAELSAAREELRCNASVIETLQAQVCMHYQSDKPYKKKTEQKCFVCRISLLLCKSLLTFFYLSICHSCLIISQYLIHFAECYPLRYDLKI